MILRLLFVPIIVRILLEILGNLVTVVIREIKSCCLLLAHLERTGWALKVDAALQHRERCLRIIHFHAKVRWMRKTGAFATEVDDKLVILLPFKIDVRGALLQIKGVELAA